MERFAVGDLQYDFRVKFKFSLLIPQDVFILKAGDFAKDGVCINVDSGIAITKEDGVTVISGVKFYTEFKKNIGGDYHIEIPVSGIRAGEENTIYIYFDKPEAWEEFK